MNKFVSNKFLFHVSIHAPTRGATNIVKFVKNVVNVSIHAPTRGATTQDALLKFPREFQSTPPHEGRR